MQNAMHNSVKNTNAISYIFWASRMLYSINIISYIHISIYRDMYINRKYYSSLKEISPRLHSGQVQCYSKSK